MFEYGTNFSWCVYFLCYIFRLNQRLITTVDSLLLPSWPVASCGSISTSSAKSYLADTLYEDVWTSELWTYVFLDYGTHFNLYREWLFHLTERVTISSHRPTQLCLTLQMLCGFLQSNSRSTDEAAHEILSKVKSVLCELQQFHMKIIQIKNYSVSHTKVALFFSNSFAKY